MRQVLQLVLPVIITLSQVSAHAQSVAVVPTTESQESKEEKSQPVTTVLATDFEGLWNTSFGPMRLVAEGKDITGSYLYQTEATVTGELTGNRFIFRYKEPETEGIGWFELKDQGERITGQWRPDGTQEWGEWEGTRAKRLNGIVWLVILEANWEVSLQEPEYSFADMLQQYFTMSGGRHVRVRRRAFHDARDLAEFCGQVKYIAEPVVVLISTHGTDSGITVQGKVIDAATVAKPLANATNVSLLHLSGCAMMNGNYANQIMELLPSAARFPISGYKGTVDWDASAIGDFIYLTLVLIRQIEPEQAVEQAILASPFLGDEVQTGSPFEPLGLTLLAPSAVEPQKSPVVVDEESAEKAKSPATP